MGHPVVQAGEGVRALELYRDEPPDLVLLDVEMPGMNRYAIALILGDVDFFKRYDDMYGHQSGDSCLQAVARRSRRSCAARATASRGSAAKSSRCSSRTRAG
jgi:PleD family two-component response regulator